jgi:hypothetical protein
VCNDVPRFAAPHTRAAPPQDITVLAGPVLVGAEPAHAPHVEFQSPFLSGSGGHGVLRAPEGESAPA